VYNKHIVWTGMPLLLVCYVLLLLLLHHPEKWRSDRTITLCCALSPPLQRTSGKGSPPHPEPSSLTGKDWVDEKTGVPMSMAAQRTQSLLQAQVPPPRERVLDNLLVRVHFIFVMIRWTGLAPWEVEFTFPPRPLPRPPRPSKR